MEPLLLPIYPDAARALGVGRTTMFELIRTGKLSTVTIGRRRLVPAAAIRSYVEDLERSAAVAS